MLDHMEKCAHQQRRLHEPYTPINVRYMQKKPYQLLSLLKYGIKMRHRGASCGDIDASVCVLIVSYRSVIINALKALIILIWLTVESGVR